MNNQKNKPICDYSNYDYQQEYWHEHNRIYEDICEKAVLKKLFQKIL